MIVDNYNVVWLSPSKNSAGSMPTGNGDIGLNVWCEEDGDLIFYISKTDSWSENGELLKIGRVRVKFNSNPFISGGKFRQELKLQASEIVILAGEAESQIKLRVWVDAMRPVIHIETESKQPVSIQVKLELWRENPRVLEGTELPYGLHNGTPHPIISDADTILDSDDDRIIWYHRNKYSIWEENLRAEKLESLLSRQKDPLLNLTFGGCIYGKEFVSEGKQTLCTATPVKNSTVSICILTEQTSTEAEWIERIGSLAGKVKCSELEIYRKAHCQWWQEFWNKSWIWIDGDEEAELVSQSYVLQRYVLACACRGKFPIKFNGSIFNFYADSHTISLALLKKGLEYEADWRLWGSPYAWQNTRLPYWTMLGSGDFEMIKPMFNMYLNMLELGKEQTKTYFKHDGFFLTESTPFWGGYSPSDVKWDVQIDEKCLGINVYIRYIWHGGFELVTMMLDYYDFTGDKHFFKETLLPMAEAVLDFYDKHWKRDADGKMQIEPSQAVETYWNVKNPTTDVAGLRYVLGRLINFSSDLICKSQKVAWSKMLNEVPNIPVSNKDEEAVLLPAEVYDPNDAKNMENPELYAIFPYRCYGVGKSDMSIAKKTFESRKNKGTGGWFQDAIHAAYVGMAEEASRFIVHNCRYRHAIYLEEGGNAEIKFCPQEQQPDIRFPGFWGPNFDWVPDQDQPSVAMIALQRMLMQTEDKEIFLFPAWPKKWNVKFKLHAPYQTIVEGEIFDGQIKNIKTTPSERITDVVCMELQ